MKKITTSDFILKSGSLMVWFTAQCPTWLPVNGFSSTPNKKLTDSVFEPDYRDAKSDKTINNLRWNFHFSNYRHGRFDWD